jgi:hypothetical protein
MSTSFQYNDGGRSEAGFKGETGDCVARSIAIVTGRPYKEVYDALAKGNASQRQTRHSKRHRATAGRKTARAGIWVRRKWFKDYMADLGYHWHATMHIGSGCKVHLRADELPKGGIIAALSKHYCAVIDGVIHDIYDPSRNGTRCVYGYWAWIG